MGQKGPFGDISYNVFNRRKTSYYMVETLYFTIFSRMDNINKNDQQKLIIVVYIRNIYKSMFSRIWCYKV